MCEITNVIFRCALEYLKRLTVPGTCFGKSVSTLCLCMAFYGKKDRRPARVEYQQAVMFLTPSRLKVDDKFQVSASFYEKEERI